MPYGPNTSRLRVILMESTPLRSQVASLAGCSEQQLARALVGEVDIDDPSWALIEAYLRRLRASLRVGAAASPSSAAMTAS